MSVARRAARVGRYFPAARVVLAAELLLTARQHVMMLEPQERRRLIELVRQARGRRRNLSPRERDELADLVAKAQPRRFAGTVAQRLSPVPIPNRIAQGPRRPRR